MCKYALYVLFSAIFINCEAQYAFAPLNKNLLNTTDTTKNLFSLTERQKLNALLITGGTVYVGSLAGLYTLWYKDHPQSKFHFFNDNAEWFQMDKFAHATNSYYIGNLGYHSLLWAGMDNKKAIWLGGLSGSVYLSIVELLDGFSAAWGASPGDIIANTSGSFLFTIQQAVWNKQNIILKHSFWPSPYAKYRPELMGYNLIQNSLKDYNGISCWMSLNLKTFFENKQNFPEWICLSVGQSGDGMLGSFSNPAKDKNGNILPVFERKRQLFLSADIDITRLPIKSKPLKTLSRIFSVVKIPFPTIEYNKVDKFKFHPVYF